MLHLVEESLEYEVAGATFYYQRLVHNDLAKLRYLANVRGLFDQATYDTACVATALRGWDNVAGKDGLIEFPLSLPASAISEADQQTIASLHLLTPTLTREERMQLHGSLYLVTKLPLDVMSALIDKVKENSPLELEKKLSETYNGGLASLTPGQALNLPALTAGETSEVLLHAIAEG